MSETLQRTGSVLVAEIKASHHPQGSNGSAVPGTATDGGAAPVAEPSAISIQSAAIAQLQPVIAHSVDPSAASYNEKAVPQTQPAVLGQETHLPPTQDGIAPVPAVAQPAPLDTSVAAGSTPGSALSPVSQTRSAVLQQNVSPTNGTNNVAAVAAAPAMPAVAAKPPKSTMSPKEINKYDKLMRTEAKNEEKSIKKALRDASSSEKLLRKTRDAEGQALKRHEKATTVEHKAAKALSKAKAEYDKMAADLEKAKEDLEIKKKHTVSTQQQYEDAKAQIEILRAQKAANDRDRAARSSSIHGTQRS